MRTTRCRWGRVAGVLLAAAGCEAPPDNPGQNTLNVLRERVERNVLVVTVGWSGAPAALATRWTEILARAPAVASRGSRITIHGSNPTEVSQSLADALRTISHDTVTYTIVGTTDLTSGPWLERPLADEPPHMLSRSPAFASCGLRAGQQQLTRDQIWCLAGVDWSANSDLQAILDGARVSDSGLLFHPDLNPSRGPSLLTRLNTPTADGRHHEVDELWVFGPPGIVKMAEGHMIGRDAFDINSAPNPGPFRDPYGASPGPDVTLDHRVAIMGFSFANGPDNALHSFAHRAEGALDWAYRTAPIVDWFYKPWNYPTDFLAHLNLWQQFAMVDVFPPRTPAPPPRIGGLGTVHYPVTALEGPATTRDGMPARDMVASSQYLAAQNASMVPTSAPAWEAMPLYDPASSLAAGLTRRATIDCTTFQCNQEDYLIWWFEHMPYGQAASRDGVRGVNWWRYVVGLAERPAMDRVALELELPLAPGSGALVTAASGTCRCHLDAAGVATTSTTSSCAADGVVAPGASGAGCFVCSGQWFDMTGQGLCGEDLGTMRCGARAARDDLAQNQCFLSAAGQAATSGDFCTTLRAAEGAAAPGMGSGRYTCTATTAGGATWR